MGVGDAALTAVGMADGLGPRAADALTAGIARFAGQGVGARLTRPTRWLTRAWPTIDRRLAVVRDCATSAVTGLVMGIRHAARAGIAVTDGVGLRTADLIAARLTRLTTECGGAGFAGAARRITCTRSAIDGLLAIVPDWTAFPGTGPGAGVGLAFLPLLVLMLLLAAPAVALASLVPLLAPLASPLGVGLVRIEEREEPAQHRQSRQQAEQSTAGARLTQGAGQAIKTAAIHMHTTPYRASTARRIRLMNSELAQSPDRWPGHPGWGDLLPDCRLWFQSRGIRRPRHLGKPRDRRAMPPGIAHETARGRSTLLRLSRWGRCRRDVMALRRAPAAHQHRRAGRGAGRSPREPWGTTAPACLSSLRRFRAPRRSRSSPPAARRRCRRWSAAPSRRPAASIPPRRPDRYRR